jgi:hypothetical protein
MVMTKGAMTPELYVSGPSFETNMFVDDPLNVILKAKDGKGSLRLVWAGGKLLLNVRPSSLCLNCDFVEFAALTRPAVLAPGAGIGTSRRFVTWRFRVKDAKPDCDVSNADISACWINALSHASQ